jgi:CheY-like chemotaxis protein
LNQKEFLIASSIPNPQCTTGVVSLSDAQKELALAPSASPEGVKTLPHVPHRPGILVVDDEARIRAWLSVALPQSGFRVKLAAGGQEAVDFYRADFQNIAVVLLDILMPGMDGPRTLQALQEINPKICCCFLNERNVYSQPELLALGAARVFRKMPPLPELVQTLWFLVAQVKDEEISPLEIPTEESAGDTSAGPTLERRARIRYLCQLEGTCQPAGQPMTGQTWIGRLRDISATGIKLLVNRRFEVGTLLALDVPRPGWDCSRLLLCHVVRVSEPKNRPGDSANGEAGERAWEVGCSLTHELSDDEVQAFLDPSE